MDGLLVVQLGQLLVRQVHVVVDVHSREDAQQEDLHAGDLRLEGVDDRLDALSDVLRAIMVVDVVGACKMFEVWLLLGLSIFAFLISYR